MQDVNGTAQENPIDRYVASRQADAPGFSKLALAEEVGCSRNAIYRIIEGDDAVSTALLEKFEAATGGALTAVELFGWWSDARKRKAARASA